MSVNEKMTAIADKIRSATKTTAKLDLDHMATGIDAVYDAGKHDGLRYLRDRATATLDEIPAGVLEGLTAIANYAFYQCNTIKSLTLPEGLETIGVAAFNSCYSIKGTLTLPSSLKSIGTLAFRYCSAINQIKVKATTPPTISGADAINTGSALSKIIVPNGCGDVYRAATNWSNYADIIVEEDEV